MLRPDFYTLFREAYDQIIQAKADELGKARCDLIPWKDFDPIMMDNKARDIARGGGIAWAGD